MPDEQLQPTPASVAMPNPIAPPKKTTDIASWSFILQFAIASLIFLGLEITYQYFYKKTGSLETSTIYGAALAGGTLIACALFSSAIFKWYPKYARFWRIRRYLGVAGALCITIHALFVLFFLFNGNLRQLYFSLNPFKNVIVFGAIAYIILFAMLLTSTDWAMRKMGKWWKFLHRFVYIAFASSIFHWILTNPKIYTDLPGATLVLMSVLAVFGQLFWFFKTIKARHYRNAGMYVGFAIILAVLITAYIAFVK